jgi:hypothetical protein
MRPNTVRDHRNPCLSSIGRSFYFSSLLFDHQCLRFTHKVLTLYSDLKYRNYCSDAYRLHRFYQSEYFASETLTICKSDVWACTACIMVKRPERRLAWLGYKRCWIANLSMQLVIRLNNGSNPNLYTSWLEESCDLNCINLEVDGITDLLLILYVSGLKRSFCCELGGYHRIQSSRSHTTLSVNETHPSRVGVFPKRIVNTLHEYKKL